MVCDSYCLLNKLYSVYKPVVNGENVLLIKPKKVKSGKEKSIANQFYVSSKKFARLESRKLFVEKKGGGPCSLDFVDKMQKS